MKKYLFLLILPLLMFLPFDTYALINSAGSEFSSNLGNVSGLTCNSRDVCYGTSTDFFGDKTFSISLGTNNRIYNTYDANYFYVMAYSSISNEDTSVQLTNNYSYTLGYWGNASYACTQLSNNDEKNLGYTTWKCPISRDGYISGFRFFTNFVQNDEFLQVASTYRYGLYRYFLAFEMDGSLETDKTIQEQTDKIISESQKTQDKIDNVDSTLNNSDVGSATNSGTGFFDSFNSSDNGGISGIITAPLNAINAMLTGSCTPLQATYKGKNISLQCGTEIWNKLGGIKEFLNLVLGGLLCYRICLRIFNIVQNLKNPDNDKVEVMDL